MTQIVLLPRFPIGSLPVPRQPKIHAHLGYALQRLQAPLPPAQPSAQSGSVPIRMSDAEFAKPEERRRKADLERLGIPPLRLENIVREVENGSVYKPAHDAKLDGYSSLPLNSCDEESSSEDDRGTGCMFCQRHDADDKKIAYRSSDGRPDCRIDDSTSSQSERDTGAGVLKWLCWESISTASPKEDSHKAGDDELHATHQIGSATFDQETSHCGCCKRHVEQA